MVPLPAKLDIVPPETVISEAVKVVDASLRVKVIVVVSPAIKLVLLALTEIVGTTVSTAIETKLLASEPSAFKLPAASVKIPLDKLTTPLVALLAVGVNKAV